MDKMDFDLYKKKTYFFSFCSVLAKEQILFQVQP